MMDDGVSRLSLGFLEREGILWNLMDASGPSNLVPTHLSQEMLHLFKRYPARHHKY